VLEERNMQAALRGRIIEVVLRKTPGKKKPKRRQYLQ